MTHAERWALFRQEIEAHAVEVLFLYEQQHLTLRALAKEMKSRGCTFSYRCLHEWLKERGYVHPQGSLKGHGRSGKPVRKVICVICHELFLPSQSQQKYCRVCIPDFVAWHHYKHYGLTLSQFNEILSAQDGKCIGCKKSLTSAANKGDSDAEIVHVDHCHETDAVRGLTCRSCNSTLGYANDKPETLRNLALYLERFAERLKKTV